MNPVLALARAEIRDLQPYAHAAWLPSLTRLHANEAPWRPAGDATRAGLNRYPEPQPEALVGRLADLYRVAPRNLLVARGSDEAIDVLSRIYLRAGTDAILQCAPTFGMYEVAARIQGAAVISVPLQPANGWRLDPDRLLSAWRPEVKIVYLCSPNNPTGNLFDLAALEAVCSALDGKSIIVLDEAYVEWSGRPSLSVWLQRFPTLAILRTLSKAYALAGARIGALLADPEMIQLAKRIIPPYALAQPTIEAALDALEPEAAAAAHRRLREHAAGARLSAARTHGLALGGAHLAERRQFPADRHQQRRHLHARQPRRRPDRARPAGEPAAAPLAADHGRHAQRERRAARQSEGGMSGRRILFVDRDGTLIEEPADEQVDSLDKIRLMPGVIPALLELRRAGFSFVMVTNQDGLGTASLPHERFDPAHRFILELFASQGIEFEAVFICPHFKRENCGCRKPDTALVKEFLAANPARSRAQLHGRRPRHRPRIRRKPRDQGIKVLKDGGADETWPAIARRLAAQARRARVERRTRETDIAVEVDLSREGPSAIRTGIGFFDHMLEQIARHAGFALELQCAGDLGVDEHHTVEDCALALGAALREALGDKRGIARYGFLLAMDEAEAEIALDISGRPVLRVGGPVRTRAGRRAADRTRAALLPLARAGARRSAAHPRARREQPPHGGVLLQGRRPQSASGHPPRGTRAAEHQGRALSATRVAIVASGGANIASLQFALERLGVRAGVSAEADVIRAASHVILPGVGAAGDAMRRLRSAGLDAVLPALRQPVLGICLGMQLLFETFGRGRDRVPRRHSRRRAALRGPAWTPGAAHRLEHAGARTRLGAARRHRRRRLRLFRAQLRAALRRGDRR